MQISITRIVDQVCHQNQFGTRCSLINAPLGSHRPWNAPSWFYSIAKKPKCKSRPGHLVSSAWCLWIVHECGIHLQAKIDISICDHKVVFQNTVTHVRILINAYKTHLRSFEPICGFVLVYLAHSLPKLLPSIITNGFIFFTHSKLENYFAKANFYFAMSLLGNDTLTFQVLMYQSI